MKTCPHCLKDYEFEKPRLEMGQEPWENEQHKIGYCSDKCYDEAISGHRPDYTYDEKGRRFDKNGVRMLFPAPPEEDSDPCDGCPNLTKEVEDAIGVISSDPCDYCEKK